MDQYTVKNAFIISLNTENYKKHNAVYGGETLINRTLIALSKSGIENAKIICNEGNMTLIEKCIHKINHRIKLTWQIIEKKNNEYLSEKISQAISEWKDPFIILESDSIWHPTLIKETVINENSDFPVLFCYKNVGYYNKQVKFNDAFNNKFKIIFNSPEENTIITMPEQTENIFNSENIQYQPGSISKQNYGLFALDIIVCSKSHFTDIRQFNTLREIIQCWLNSDKLKLRFIANAWWLKITSKLTKEQIKEFFWRLAFKEISGEFSKLVNSRFSKPMTFLFVKLGFSPNAISIIEIVLFLFATAFLFIPDYWGMIVFAVIWQFSAGVLDRCDGEVARLRNYESPAGGRFDMLIDDLRFAIPLTVLGIVCYLENPVTYLYPLALIAILLWYIPAAMYQQIFMYRAGYVSIQAMGVDYFKAHEKEIPKTSWKHKFRPFLKGDIRTFYVFLLAFTGYKPAIFWVLCFYELIVGIGNYLTVKGMRNVVLLNRTKILKR
jgi:phosphatidylglycerophosphate synthase